RPSGRCPWSLRTHLCAPEVRGDKKEKRLWGTSRLETLKLNSKLELLLGGGTAGVGAGATLFAFLAGLVMGFAFSGFLVCIGLGCFGGLLVATAGLSK